MAMQPSPSKQYWGVKETRLLDLLDAVDSKKIALPQFQRAFKWTPRDYIPFLHSVLQNKVTGSLLLLEVGPDSSQFAPRKIDRAPDVDPASLSLLLLDGQQRTTSLYHALRTGFIDKYLPYLDVISMLDNSNFLEDHIKRDRKIGDTPEEQAQSGRLELNLLLDSTARGRWEDEFLNTKYCKDQGWKRSHLMEAMKERVALYEDLKNYAFPTVQLEKESPPSVIVDIFQNLNRRGQRLNEFELMIARCFNAKEPKTTNPYDLKSHWEKAYDSTSYLKQIGVSVDDGLLPLYLIACALKRETNELGSRPLGADAVLSIDPRYVTGESIHGAECSLETAVVALEEAAELLYQHCGVLDSTLMPQVMMLLPIADQFFLARPNRPALPKLQLTRWFWISGLRGNFYGSTTSYVTPACQQLEAWSKDIKKSVPEAVRRFDSSSVDSLHLRDAKARGGDIVGKTVLAMLAAAGSLDWKAGNGSLRQQVEGNDHEVQAHHIIPEKTLMKYFKCDKGDDRTRPIANFAPTSQPANGSLGSYEPTQVKTELKGDYEDILRLSQVPIEEFEKVKSAASFERFLIARETLLKQKIAALLDL